jgi:hypothetical protein
MASASATSPAVRPATAFAARPGRSAPTISAFVPALVRRRAVASAVLRDSNAATTRAPTFPTADSIAEHAATCARFRSSATKANVSATLFDAHRATVSVARPTSDVATGRVPTSSVMCRIVAAATGCAQRSPPAEMAPASAPMAGKPATGPAAPAGPPASGESAFVPRTTSQPVMASAVRVGRRARTGCVAPWARPAVQPTRIATTATLAPLTLAIRPLTSAFIFRGPAPRPAPAGLPPAMPPGAASNA